MPMPQKPCPVKSCERCGVIMHRKRYNGVLEDMGRFAARKFCSLRCANSRGIRSPSSSSQHRLSATCGKKHCESCGAIPPRGQLHVHHLDGNWRNHRPENLRTLCIACHLGKSHKKPVTPCHVCGAKSRKRGMCQKHYQRWKKYGDPLLTKKRLAGTPNEYSLERD